MKLCIFSGTFNPIHKAHLKMAEYVLSHYGFDKIIFIPAYKPPHKDYDTNMCQHRFNMVKLAIKIIHILKFLTLNTKVKVNHILT